MSLKIAPRATRRIVTRVAVATGVCAVVAIVALGYLLVRHHRLGWLAHALIGPSSAAEVRMPVIGTTYPDAGWLPYKKGPFVTPVAQMYGSHPLTVCAIPGGVAGSCLTANSDAIIANLWGKNPTNFNTAQMLLGGTWIYATEYAKSGWTVVPYFQSTASDPRYAVARCTTYPSACDTGSVHIPAGAIPEAGTDHHLYVRDLSTKQDWSFWIAPLPSGSGGPYVPIGSGNVEHVDASSEGLGLGGTAGNISLAWSERPQDVLVGRIPHALSLRVTCITTNDGVHGSYVYPVVPGTTSHRATDDNYLCGYPSSNQAADQEFIPNSPSNVNLPYGAHLWLDSAPKPEQRGTAGCDIIAYAELRALNEFGGYVDDVGSAQWFKSPIFVNRMADINDTYDGNPNGTVSYWAQVGAQIGQPSSPGSTWYYSVPNCGIDLAQHLHVLIPPTPN